MSPIIKALIEKGLFERLPATFSTFFFEQIKDWATLFPAERSYHERLFTLIDGLPAGDTAELFASLRSVEMKMGVNEKNWPRRTFTLEQVDFLNRNPHYAQWRESIAAIFSRLDPVLEDKTRRRGRPRLIIILSPAELPVGPERMWMRIRGGLRAQLDGELDPSDHLAPLFAAGTPREYDRWIVQADATLPVAAASVRLSYDALATYRSRLMTAVRGIVEGEHIRGPRELGARLKKIHLRPEESESGRDPVLAEFTRSVLLAGNGTLLINNTFVEWATVQALRRARPALLVASFGIRNKLKPFSSLLIYTDQDEANPVPGQMDTLGTYVDLEVFYQYIWQEAQKYAEYANNTVYLFLARRMDEFLYVAPPDFRLPQTVRPDVLMGAAKEWLQW